MTPGIMLDIQNLIKKALSEAHMQGMKDGKADAYEEAARVAECFKRDASFDDSQVGAMEHNANQANIAAAIRALKK